MRQNGQPHYSYKAERLTLNEAENVLYASTDVAII